MFDEKLIWKLQDEAGLKLKKKNWNHICAIFEVKIWSEQTNTKNPDYNVDESITDHICKWSYWSISITIKMTTTTIFQEQEANNKVAYSITVNGENFCNMWQVQFSIFNSHVSLSPRPLCPCSPDHHINDHNPDYQINDYDLDFHIHDHDINQIWLHIYRHDHNNDQERR